MITKKIAGDLYGNGFMLQDKEGRVFKIDSVHDTCFTVKDEFIVKAVQFVKIGTDYHILARPLSDLTKEIPFEGKIIDPYLTLLAYRKTKLDYEIIVDMYKNDFDNSRLELLSHKVVFVMQTLHFAIGFHEGSWIPVTDNNNPYK